MAAAPVTISGQAFLDRMRNDLVVVVDEASLDLGGNTVPIAIDIGGEVALRQACAAEIAFADGAREGFNIVGR